MIVWPTEIFSIRFSNSLLRIYLNSSQQALRNAQVAPHELVERDPRNDADDEPIPAATTPTTAATVTATSQCGRYGRSYPDGHDAGERGFGWRRHVRSQP